MTRAPFACASWTIIAPTPPLAPWTSTVSPAPTPVAASVCAAVTPATMIPPAFSQLMALGLGTRALAATRTRLA